MIMSLYNCVIMRICYYRIPLLHESVITLLCYYIRRLLRKYVFTKSVIGYYTLLLLEVDYKTSNLFLSRYCLRENK